MKVTLDASVEKTQAISEGTEIQKNKDYLKAHYCCGAKEDSTCVQLTFLNRKHRTIQRSNKRKFPCSKGRIKHIHKTSTLCNRKRALQNDQHIT